MWLEISSPRDGVQLYHTVLLVHKTIIHRQPVYLYDKLMADGSYPYSTRKAKTSSIKQSSSYRTKLEICRQSFRWRGALLYEKVPSSIRDLVKMEKFKKVLDSWIRKTTPI